MKFGKRYSKMSVTMAMLHGVVVGIVAVAIVALIVAGAKGKQPVAVADKVIEVPTQGPAPADPTPSSGEASVQLFAKQHGVFSTADAAALFISEDPSLAKAAVIHANGQYFVWSAVGVQESEVEVSEYEGTFRKPFTADTSACGAVGAGELQGFLMETEYSKIKISESSETAGTDALMSKEFDKNIAAITAFTKDLRVVRLLLLSHYSHTDKCVKITF